MKSHQFLNQANVLVKGQREKDYGDKVNNHKNIAKLWTAYLDTYVDPHDVAIMMSLLKIARTINQANCLFLAAFQRATSFQQADQIMSGITQ